MRILLLGPVHREKEYLKQKGNKPFLIGQGQQSWVDALQALNHTVHVFRYTDSYLVPNSSRIYGEDYMSRFLPRIHAKWRRLNDLFYNYSIENKLKNKKLMHLAKEIRPEVVFISGGLSSLFPETIRKIKEEYQCPVLLFSGINPEYASTVVERRLVKESIIDVVVENDTGYASLWKKLGAQRVIVLPISSVDPKLHHTYELTAKEQQMYSADICFVGTLSQKRQEILAQLSDYNLKIWGDIPAGMSISKHLQKFYHGGAHGIKMAKIFNAAKIVLNFQPQDMSSGGNMRTFEIPGCGAFQLADKVNPEWFEDKKEIVLFKTIDDLKTKINYYLDNKAERSEIAKKGYERARNEHTYEKHFQKLLQEIQ